jgi:hypothetical protein
MSLPSGVKHMTLFERRSDESRLLFFADGWLHRLRSVVSRSASSVAGAWGSALMAAGLATLAGGTAARALDWSPVVLLDAAPLRIETWAGADITSRSWLAYSGVTLALFGPIDSDGWRLRAVGGYGAYGYAGTRAISGQSSPQAFRGTVSFADLLLGYQKVRRENPRKISELGLRFGALGTS